LATPDERAPSLVVVPFLDDTREVAWPDDSSARSPE